MPTVPCSPVNHNQFTSSERLFAEIAKTHGSESTANKFRNPELEARSAAI